MKRKINRSVVVLSVVLILLLLNIFSCRKNPSAPPPGGKNIDSTKIIYTDVNPDSVLLSRSITDSFKLDLDNDSIADFELDRVRITLCYDNFLGTWAYETDLSIKPLNAGNAVMIDGSDFPFALDSNSIISNDSLWANGSGVLLAGATYATGHCITTLPAIRGFWIHASDKYLGLKIAKNNHIYFGWARLTSSYSLMPPPYRNLISPGQLVLKDYAYNSAANENILTGQMK